MFAAIVVPQELRFGDGLPKEQPSVMLVVCIRRLAMLLVRQT
jgi:hypothetical protein